MSEELMENFKASKVFDERGISDGVMINAGEIVRVAHTHTNHAPPTHPQRAQETSTSIQNS